MDTGKLISSWMTRILAICVIIFLALYFLRHIVAFFLLSVENSTIIGFSSEKANNNNITLQPEVVISNLEVGRARYDNQRILRIYDFYFTGSQWDYLLDKYDICFATQASLERMHWVSYILQRWTGPLSIAIQLTSEEEWLIFNLYMSYLSTCHSKLQSQIAIHLVVPSNLNALIIDDKLLSQWEGISLETIMGKGETCPDAKEYLKYLLDTLPTIDKRKLAYKEVYPQNHMRNIGRKGCGTHWTFSADVDIIPGNGTADMLQQFYNELKIHGKLCTNCAYVIPTFELNYTFHFPESKKELVDLFKIGATQPYHINTYPPAQEATEYNRWVSYNFDEEAVTIAYEINRTKLEFYEPFYVSPDNIVPFDERFLGYGYTRNSQFKAAVTAGWNFSVLTPVFTIHWGLQTKLTYEFTRKGGYGESVRREQNKKNQCLYKIYVQELECKKKIGTL